MQALATSNKISDKVIVIYMSFTYVYLYMYLSLNIITKEKKLMRFCFDVVYLQCYLYLLIYLFFCN